ncbi:MAG TPA: hypothetical protein VHZ97_07305 [Pseudonocardiaceae bacterium]|nr:hypothetical protein [Pseudonocardiaceae bacterium]
MGVTLETQPVLDRPTTPADPGDVPSRRTRRWPGLLAVLGGTALIGAHASLYGQWMVDDASITFAYARSVAEGYGPVLQPGAVPVEGYSNTTWMLLLAFGRLIGLFDHGAIFGIPDYVLFPKALALLCCAGILLAYHCATRMLFPRRAWLATLVGGVMLAANPSFVIWCFSGLENSLYALLIVTSAVLMLRAVLGHRLLTTKVAVLTGLLAFLAALTRPDGMIYAAAYPLLAIVFLHRYAWKPTLLAAGKSVLAFAVPYGLFLVWRYHEFHLWVTNTTVAKSQNAPDLMNLARGSDLIGYVGWAAVLVAVGCIGVVLTQQSNVRNAVVALVVPLVLAIAAYCVLNSDWMGQYRFATPVWALGSLAVTIAVAHVAATARFRGRVALTVAVVLAVAISGDVAVHNVKQFRAITTLPMCTVADRYEMMNGYADILGITKGSELVPDIGGTSLTAKLQILDLAGLASGPMAKLESAHNMAKLRDYVFDVAKPTFMNFHAPWSLSTNFYKDPRITADYYQIFSTPNPVDDSDWVRKDAVGSPAKLAALRAYAAKTYNKHWDAAPDYIKGGCGDTLRPGQLPPSNYAQINQ